MTRAQGHCDALWQAGLSNYHASQNAQAIEAFLGMEAAARQLGDPERLLWSRFWQGVALHGAGKHDEALFVLGRALDDTPLTVCAPVFYMTLTRLLRAAVEIPLPLAEIEASIRSSEELLLGAGLPNRRSRILIVRARLELSRGNLGAARDLAEQSLERWRREQYTCSGTSHFGLLAKLELWLGRLDAARALLEA